MSTWNNSNVKRKSWSWVKISTFTINVSVRQMLVCFAMTAVLVSLPKGFAPVINSERTSQHCLFHQSCIDIIIYIHAVYGNFFTWWLRQMNLSECFKGLCNTSTVAPIRGVGWICSDKTGTPNIFIITWHKHGRRKAMENPW